MPSMILTKADKIHGKSQPAGHRFEASDKEAQLWRALGRARDFTAKDSTAEAQPGQPAVSDRPETGAGASERRAGRYNRRDMRAEG